MLEAISDMKVTVKLLKESTNEDVAVSDQNYKKLGCNIKVLKRNSEEYKLLSEYFNNTKGNYSRVTIGDIFEIERPTEMASFNSKLGNNMLLWHGSGIANFVGILSQGMRIAPPEAPASGYLFGKGIYLADLAEKSIGYCRANCNSKALILLIEVTLM
jgi:poly [ADP-ribose] polymerase